MNMEDCLMLRSILASNLRHGGRQYATRLGRCVDGWKTLMRTGLRRQTLLREKAVR